MRFPILVLPILFGLISCSSSTPKGKTEAEVLIKEAQEQVEAGRYLLATEKLNELKIRYPYSIFVVEAELMLADIRFEQGKFIEAAASYKLFRDLHPKHAKADYVLFRMAESNYQQIPSTFDRDLTSARKSIIYFNELKQLYPNSAYLDDAEKKKDYAKNLLVLKEKYIADFYFKTEVYDAAVFRYKILLTEFPYISDAQAGHAKVRIIESHLEQGNFAECLSSANLYLGDLSGAALSDAQRFKQECQEQVPAS